MTSPPAPPRRSLALLTDLYELTMASAYWKSGRAGDEAVFHLTFRKNPFGGGFAVACGLAGVVDFLDRLTFDASDLEYLRGLTGADGAPLLDPGFLAALAGFRFTGDVDAVPEGTVVFPHEPLVRVQGPILQAQIIETAVLNLVNFPTLVATKAARLCLAAHGDPVIEFGLRRAQGIDGGLTASRAAYVGGCAATSNVLAGKLYGIPVRGTHAHSWVMCFDDELSAFRTYAEALPNNCVFLVDTYDTLQGVRNAITVGRELRARGQDLQGIRLDSGDLAWLSQEARRLLDEAGFTSTVIVASNDLDERLVHSLKSQGAAITVWGVGTRLVTGWDEPALGGVYKLSAIRRPGGAWLPRLKLSEQARKISTPGILQVRRLSAGGEFRSDVIYDEERGLPRTTVMVDPLDPTRRRELPDTAAGEDLLRPVFRQGRCLATPPSPTEARARAQDQLARFHAGIKRFDNPHAYPVGLEQGLHQLRTDLVLQARTHHP